MQLYDKILDAAFWKKVRSDPAYADIISLIRADYEEQAREPLIALPFSLRNRFYTDGDRSQFEKYYFGRRVLLSSAAILALLYPENERYLRDVEDTLWAICDEYSWAVPAHCTNDYADGITRVDLFVAETGAAVAEITALLKERLHETVFVRARAELKRRVFENYRNRHFDWETVRTNWSAVCAGGIGIAMMYAAPELLAEFLPRLLASEQCCMDSYTEDGVCLEGMSYWAYGFGYFVYFADLLYRFTDGKTDLFADPKVKLMATFPQRNLMMGDTATSFADGDMHAKVPLDLYHFLHRRYPDTVMLPPKERMAFNRGNCRFVQYLRHFAYFDPTLKGEELPKTTSFFPIAGQYITTRDTFSFAVKAGRNDEPHNHNDVGTFILSTEKGQELCDLGAGLYTRQYFSSERYTIFCNSSLSHSVPIINGLSQHAGATYGGSIAVNGDTVTLEIGGAYPADVGSITRTFVIGEKCVQLTDAWTDRVKSFTERFVSVIEPTVTAGAVRFAQCTLHFDPQTVTPTVSVEKHYTHDYKKDAIHSALPQPVYCVDFAVDPAWGQITFSFDM